MTAVAPDTRQTLYRRFSRHNRFIGALRLLVPLLGAGLLVIPFGQMLVSAFVPGFSVNGIRLENDTLVIAAPRFEGTLANGDPYYMTADRAESRVGDLDTIDLYDLDLDLSGAGGYRADAVFSRAQWTMSTEQLYSNEDVVVSDSTGASGVLAGVELDWPGQVVTSDGPVRFDFEGGNRLLAREMYYDMNASHWRFTRVSLQMTPAEDSGGEREIEDYIVSPEASEAP